MLGKPHIITNATTGNQQGRGSHPSFLKPMEVMVGMLMHHSVLGCTQRGQVATCSRRTSTSRIVNSAKKDAFNAIKNGFET